MLAKFDDLRKILPSCLLRRCVLRLSFAVGFGDVWGRRHWGDALQPVGLVIFLFRGDLSIGEVAPAF